MPIVDVENLLPVSGSSYPEPHASEMGNRAWKALGAAGGLTQFGVNLMILQPGSKSSLRHWHSHEDEFVLMLKGELILAQDSGESLMYPGDAATFAAGDTDGHHFINRSASEARFLVVGTRAPADVCTYSEVDLAHHWDGENAWFSRHDGTPLK